MTLSFTQSVLIILVIAAITFGLRATPFVLFSRTGGDPQSDYIPWKTRFLPQ